VRRDLASLSVAHVAPRSGRPTTHRVAARLTVAAAAAAAETHRRLVSVSERTHCKRAEVKNDGPHARMRDD